jgi:hypothetical protein
MKHGSVYIRFFADMLDEPGKLCETLVRGIDQPFESILHLSNVEIRIPNVVPPVRDRNITYASYGESTPQGLNVRRSEEIWNRFEQIWRDGTEISEGEWRSELVTKTFWQPSQRRRMRRFLKRISHRVARFF